LPRSSQAPGRRPPLHRLDEPLRRQAAYFAVRIFYSFSCASGDFGNVTEDAILDVGLDLLEIDAVANLERAAEGAIMTLGDVGVFLLLLFLTFRL